MYFDLYIHPGFIKSLNIYISLNKYNKSEMNHIFTSTKFMQGERVYITLFVEYLYNFDSKID